MLRGGGAFAGLRCDRRWTLHRLPHDVPGLGLSRRPVVFGVRAHDMSEAGTSLRPSAVTRAAEPLVRCEALTVRFVGREGTVRAVNGVDFTLDAGEVLCIVGESGAGKSVALRAVMRLLPAHITDISGTITIAGKDVMRLDRRALADLPGADVALVFH